MDNRRISAEHPPAELHAKISACAANPDCGRIHRFGCDEFFQIGEVPGGDGLK